MYQLHDTSLQHRATVILVIIFFITATFLIRRRPSLSSPMNKPLTGMTENRTMQNELNYLSLTHAHLKDNLSVIFYLHKDVLWQQLQMCMEKIEVIVFFKFSLSLSLLQRQWFMIPTDFCPGVIFSFSAPNSPKYSSTSSSILLHVFFHLCLQYSSRLYIYIHTHTFSNKENTL